MVSFSGVIFAVLWKTFLVSPPIQDLCLFFFSLTWDIPFILSHNVFSVLRRNTLNIGVLCNPLVWDTSTEHEKARKASGKGRKGDNNSHLTDILWVDVALAVWIMFYSDPGLRATVPSPGISSEWWVCDSKETCWLTQLLDNYNKQNTLILSSWFPPAYLWQQQQRKPMPLILPEPHWY